jgi:2-keto-4-pentenoate hydratase/2-oxohepta-3-ene-1,7-dioic acid hydratase in catechol pathway
MPRMAEKRWASTPRPVLRPFSSSPRLAASRSAAQGVALLVGLGGLQAQLFATYDPVGAHIDELAAALQLRGLQGETLARGFCDRQNESMRLATANIGGNEIAVVVHGGGAVPVAEIPNPDGWPTGLLSLIEDGLMHDLGRRWDALSEKEQEDLAARSIPVADLTYAPLYRRPRKIWGIGLNYTEHAGDLDEKAPAEEPASFMRPDTTIIGPGDGIRLPEDVGRVTAEAELAVVIGQEAKDVPEEEAPSVVAGFTTVLDMTAEDVLKRNPRYLTRAKSFDTFFSFGPELVTPDEVGEVEGLEVSTVLNGEVRRTNTVSNMTFSPWFLVSFHSRVMRLLPGDVISTGTPGAVAIREGDVAECRISGFKPLANPVVG